VNDSDSFSLKTDEKDVQKASDPYRTACLCF